LVLVCGFPHYRDNLEKKPVVDWFEIISENFMCDGGQPLEVLDQILERYRVVQQGVSMYFGSAESILGGLVFFALLMPETKPQESLGFEPPQGDISTSKPA
jgi:uncharacterized protein (UPF0276 family)